MGFRSGSDMRPGNKIKLGTKTKGCKMQKSRIRTKENDELKNCVICADQQKQYKSKRTVFACTKILIILKTQVLR